MSNTRLMRPAEGVAQLFSRYSIEQPLDQQARDHANSYLSSALATQFRNLGQSTTEDETTAQTSNLARVEWLHQQIENKEPGEERTALLELAAYFGSGQACHELINMNLELAHGSAEGIEGDRPNAGIQPGQITFLKSVVELTVYQSRCFAQAAKVTENKTRANAYQRPVEFSFINAKDGFSEERTDVKVDVEGVVGKRKYETVVRYKPNTPLNKQLNGAGAEEERSMESQYEYMLCSYILNHRANTQQGERDSQAAILYGEAKQAVELLDQQLHNPDASFDIVRSAFETTTVPSDTTQEPLYTARNNAARLVVSFTHIIRAQAIEKMGKAEESLNAVEAQLRKKWKAIRDGVRIHADDDASATAGAGQTAPRRRSFANIAREAIGRDGEKPKDPEDPEALFSNDVEGEYNGRISKIKKLKVSVTDPDGNPINRHLFTQEKIERITERYNTSPAKLIVDNIKSRRNAARSALESKVREFESSNPIGYRLRMTFKLMSHDLQTRGQVNQRHWQSVETSLKQDKRRINRLNSDRDAEYGSKLGILENHSAYLFLRKLFTSNNLRLDLQTGLFNQAGNVATHDSSDPLLAELNSNDLLAFYLIVDSITPHNPNLQCRNLDALCRRMQNNRHPGDGTVSEMTNLHAYAILAAAILGSDYALGMLANPDADYNPLLAKGLTLPEGFTTTVHELMANPIEDARAEKMIAFANQLQTVENIDQSIFAAFPWACATMVARMHRGWAAQNTSAFVGFDLDTQSPTAGEDGASEEKENQATRQADNTPAEGTEEGNRKLPGGPVGGAATAEAAAEVVIATQQEENDSDPTSTPSPAATSEDNVPAAPTTPPPPMPAAPRPVIGRPAVAAGAKQKSGDLLAAIRGGAKLKKASSAAAPPGEEQQPPAEAKPGDLLAAIRGGAKLKRTNPPAGEAKRGSDATAGASGAGMMAIVQEKAKKRSLTSLLKLRKDHGEHGQPYQEALNELGFSDSDVAKFAITSRSHALTGDDGSDDETGDRPSFS